MTNLDVERVEIILLLEGIYRHYGFDLREMSEGPIRRRVMHCMKVEGVGTVSALQGRILRRTESLRRFLAGLCSRSTGMFADPDFYGQVRDTVVPLLRTFPTIRIWLAGCATGEAAYSLAIVLWEAGLYHRCHIYATDLDEAMLAQAKAGRYSLTAMTGYAGAYATYGGLAKWPDYFRVDDGQAVMVDELRSHLIVAQHSLATDASFNEFAFIVSRDTMRHANATLRGRAYGLLHASLCPFGIVAVGSRDGFRDHPRRQQYQGISGCKYLYRRCW